MKTPGKSVRCSDGPEWQVASGAGRRANTVAPGSIGAEGNAADIRTSIILPAYNERAALPRVLTSIFEIIDQRYEVIVVDDGSQDGTAAIAARFPCRVIRHKRNRGKGAAVHTGLLAASGQYIIVIDADNTYPAGAIPEMVQQLADHDFVRCVRSPTPGSMPFVNQIGNVVFDGALRLMHGLQGRDQLTGLYGLRRDVLRQMNLASDGFDLEVEIDVKAHAHHLRTASLPIIYQPRLGEKKLRPVRDGWRILKRAYTMALLYNPVLTFVIPAVVIWLVGALFVVSFKTMGYGGPDPQHDIGLLLVLGLSVGLQCFTAAIAMSLFARHLGEPARVWLLWLGSPRLRRTIGVVGLVMNLVGDLVLALILLGQEPTLREAFGTEHVAAAGGSLLLIGVQMMVAAVALSVVAGESSSEPEEQS